VLIGLVQAALGQRPPTPANIGAAVAAVMAPPDGTSPSVLGQIVPWWATFLQATRGSTPSATAVALMQQLLNNTVAYMQAGYQSGLLLPALAPIRRAQRLHARR
jgi:large repetitive protein